MLAIQKAFSTVWPQDSTTVGSGTEHTAIYELIVFSRVRP